MNAQRAKPSMIERFAYLPQPDGPHARLGVVWFIVACVACAFGTVAVAALFAAVAAVAAMQTVRSWCDVGRRANPVLAGVAAAVIPVASIIGPIGLGLGTAVAVVALVVGGAILRSDVLVGSRSAIVPAMAAGAVVLIGRADMGALVVLLVLVSAYEAGDYLMGAEAGSIFEGPLSGIAAVLVVTFAEAVFQFGPFDSRAGWVFGALVAALAPLGAPLASALAPSARAPVPALRRLDAWFVVAPVWGLMLVNYLDSIR